MVWVIRIGSTDYFDYFRGILSIFWDKQFKHYTRFRKHQMFLAYLI